MLARAGHDVHFLLRSDFEHVRRNGLRVDSILGNFHLPHVQAHLSVESMPACETTIVALKTTQNHLLPSLLPPLTREGGDVLVLQNGLAPEVASAAIVGQSRVFGGVCFLCSNKVGPGHIRHLDFGRIVMGHHRPAADPPAGITPELQRLVDSFRSAGIDAIATEDQWLARWKKLMWNIPFNGLSVVLNASSDRLINNPASAALAESLMREVHQSAAACGRAVPESTIEEMMNQTRRMVPYDSSMRLDYLGGRPLEVEAIFGDPVRAAIAAGYQPTRVETLYRQLQFLDESPRPTTQTPRADAVADQ
jgi:2-dehydropantoate 2-reductase